MFQLIIHRKNLFVLSTILLLFLTFIADGQTIPPTQIALEREKAFKLAAEKRYLEALPFFEKVAESNPIDADFWAEYSIAIHARSLTLETPEARRRERLAARAIAIKAIKLGADDTRVTELAEKIPEDGGGDFAKDPKVNQALIEAERYFQNGDYDKAFLAYERAHKLDPTLYEAALYAGDCFYAKKEYDKAIPWFAKAVAIDANREAAYRFWGDSLEIQGKPLEARDKFIEAVVAEPFLSTTWQRLQRWAERSGNGWNPIGVMPPGGAFFGAINVDETLLKDEDGTNSWRQYAMTRELWRKQMFKKEFPDAVKYRQSLREETAALKAVAENAKKDLAAGKVKSLETSLKNLIKINDDGLLEAYVLFPRINTEIAEDYDAYREKNRDNLRRFILEYLVGLPPRKERVT